MEQLEKRIQINDNRILIYNISKGYAKDTYTIMEGFLDKGDVIKTYTLSQWDDYGFNGWVNQEKGMNRISFEFDKNHPLYLPFFHLLNYDKELLIEDDDTIEDDINYLLVYRKNQKIYMDFIDNIEDNSYKMEKFYVFIKNIGIDGRSKIDQKQKDTKRRLFTFFHEVYEELMNDYQQISMESYLLDNNTDDNYKEMQKVFKRKI